jgi:hypothetical protein
MTVLFLHLDSSIMRGEFVCRNAVSPWQNNCTWRSKRKYLSGPIVFQQYMIVARRSIAPETSGTRQDGSCTGPHSSLTNRTGTVTRCGCDLKVGEYMYLRTHTRRFDHLSHEAWFSGWCKQLSCFPSSVRDQSWKFLVIWRRLLASARLVDLGNKSG